MLRVSYCEERIVYLKNMLKDCKDDFRERHIKNLIKAYEYEIERTEVKR